MASVVVVPDYLYHLGVARGLAEVVFFPVDLVVRSSRDVWKAHSGRCMSVVHVPGTRYIRRAASYPEAFMSEQWGIELIFI